MRRWAKAEQDRDQLVLFTLRLDEAIPLDHPVRVFDAILGQIDFSAWEAEYCDAGPGRPPIIHPPVLAGAVLYGLLSRLRTSRGLEAALSMRIDNALGELERLEAAGEEPPARLPLTDPQARITPNKVGDFAPTTRRWRAWTWKAA